MTRVPGRRYLFFCLIAVGGLSGDLISKDRVFSDLGYPAGVPVPLENGRHLFFSHLPGIEGVSVPYINGWVTFRLFTSFNEGALWGFGQGHTWLFASLSVIAVIGVVCWLFVFGAARSGWLTVALALIMAGTLGNLYDRLGGPGYFNLQGDPIYAVRDFLLFTFGGWPWPVFNFADVFLVTGAVMLVLHSFQTPKQEDSSAIEEKAARAKSVEPRAT